MTYQKNAFKFLLLVSTTLLAGACQTSASRQHMVDVQAKQSPYWDIIHSQNESVDLYDQGRKYLASSDYGLAINAFRSDLNHNGPSVKALNGLGVTYDMLGRYDLSQKYYEQALSLEPHTALTYSNLAYSQYKQGYFDNAIQLAAAAKDLVEGESASAMIQVAQANQSLAEQKFKQESEPENQKSSVLSAHVVKRVSDREWQMEKPENNTGIFSVAYKSDLPIAKIMKQKDQVNKYTEPQAETEVLPETPDSRASENDVFEVSVMDVPIPAVKPQIKMEPTPEELLNFKVASKTHEKRVEYSFLNGTGRPDMANRIATYVNSVQARIYGIQNARHFGHEMSKVYYAPGHLEQAKAVADLFPVPVKVVEKKGMDEIVQFVIGHDLLDFDTSIYEGTIEI